MFDPRATKGCTVGSWSLHSPGFPLFSFFSFPLRQILTLVLYQWAVDFGGNGTTVNAVSPGPVPSDMLDDIPGDLKELQKIQTAVENRFGTVEEIANIVAMLASPAASWISGQCINASGGYQMV